METVLTASRTQQAVTVNEPVDVSAARRAGGDLAREAGFDVDSAARLALVVTEATTNILKHAGHGEVLMRTIAGNARDGKPLRGIEALVLDRGPGMADADASMVDGMSTVGTYGVGMGAIARQSDAFEIFSAAGHGTVLRIVIWERPGVAVETWQTGLVCLPLAGEQCCGDAGWCAVRDEQVAVLVSDGLGHGEHAAEASDTAVEVMQQLSFALPPAELAQRMHAAMQRTRGAAAAIARIDGDQVTFSGVGNIAAMVLDDGRRKHLVSHNGIVGHNLRRAQQSSLPWQDTSLLIMHSDGLLTRWDLDDYPGLASAHPALIAGVLYRDFYRGRDDVTVLVLRKGNMP